MIDTQALRGAIFGEYKNLTAFCEVSGVPRATMDNLLNGRNAPMWPTVEKIVAALHKQTAEQKYHIFFAEELA